MSTQCRETAAETRLRRLAAEMGTYQLVSEMGTYQDTSELDAEACEIGAEAIGVLRSLRNAVAGWDEDALAQADCRTNARVLKHWQAEAEALLQRAGAEP